MKIVEIFTEDSSKLKKMGSPGYQPGQAQARTKVNSIQGPGDYVVVASGAAASDVFHLLNVDVSKVKLPIKLSILMEGGRPLLTIYYEVVENQQGPLCRASFDRENLKNYPLYGTSLRKIGELQQNEKTYHITVSNRVSSEESVKAARKIIEIIHKYR